MAAQTAQLKNIKNDEAQQRQTHLVEPEPGPLMANRMATSSVIKDEATNTTWARPLPAWPLNTPQGLAAEGMAASIASKDMATPTFAWGKGNASTAKDIWRHVVAVASPEVAKRQSE